MEDKSILDIEINSAKDIAFLKDINLDEIEDLRLYVFCPIPLRFLKNFKNLNRLLIGGSVKDYSPVSDCTTLETLYISTSGAIDNLDFIKPLSIKTLELECFRTKAKPFIIPNLETIESLSISSVSAIVDLSFLSEFANLKKLSLFEQQSKVLFDFTKLKKLQVLHLTNMFHLKNFQELKTKCNCLQKQTMKRKKYLGAVFAIPTTKKEYLTGIVVREQGSILLGYFFKTIYQTPPNQDIIDTIINDDILYIKQVSNMGLKDGSWKEIGQLEIDKSKWIIPVFTLQDILTKEFYAVQVNEKLDEIAKKRITEEESKNMYKTGLAGSIFMEEFLSMLIYK
ncbi:Imm26 family immunity protein [Flavobacterium quisquiliarum]|uniref:Imm26 family immunity protein n=1 Tax=Flavobacterium quisquiliarum TaxID=1834436 RepID=A0ABV8W9Y4_9FLAO|nr:Imm26 family immunity protein [Flavobacterium quisquiliarum]MBW1657934.1 hypothetical protein [Flavobacterium quisquiliarum]NWL00992.1 hypothetical protein [Flavobacterium collinsii]